MPSLWNLGRRWLRPCALLGGVLPIPAREEGDVPVVDVGTVGGSGGFEYPGMEMRVYDMPTILYASWEDTGNN